MLFSKGSGVSGILPTASCPMTAEEFSGAKIQWPRDPMFGVLVGFHKGSEILGISTLKAIWSLSIARNFRMDSKLAVPQGEFQPLLIQLRCEPILIRKQNNKRIPSLPLPRMDEKRALSFLRTTWASSWLGLLQWKMFHGNPMSVRFLLSADIFFCSECHKYCHLPDQTSYLGIIGAFREKPHESRTNDLQTFWEVSRYDKERVTSLNNRTSLTGAPSRRPIDVICGTVNEKINIMSEFLCTYVRLQSAFSICT